MGYIDDHPNYEIVTKEQARNWITAQIDALEKVRKGCLVVFPGEKQKTIEFQRSAYRKFITKHGGVLGMLAVLYRCGKLGKASYGMLKSNAMALLGPSLVIGRYNWFSHVEHENLTEEEARKWLIEQLEDLKIVRQDCNVHFPNDRAKTVDYQQRAEGCFMVKHGGMLGMLVALHRCRMLGDVAHNEFHAKIMALLAPTVVGERHIVI